MAQFDVCAEEARSGSLKRWLSTCGSVELRIDLANMRDFDWFGVSAYVRSSSLRDSRNLLLYSSSPGE